MALFLFLFLFLFPIPPARRVLTRAPPVGFLGSTGRREDVEGFAISVVERTDHEFAERTPL